MFGISSNRHQEFSEDDLHKVRKLLIDVDYESDCETAPLSWSSLEVSSPVTTQTPSKSPSKKKDKHNRKGSEPDFIVSFSSLESPSSSSKKSSKSKKKKEKKSRKSDEKAKSSSKSSKKSSPKPSKKTMGPSPNDRWRDLKVPEQRTRSKSSKTESKRRTKSMGYVKSKEVMSRSVPTSKTSKKSMMEPNFEASSANDKWWDLKDPKRRTSRSKSSKTESKRRTKSLPMGDITSKDAINKSLAKKKKNRKKSKSSKTTKQDPKPKFDATKIFKMNVRKLQTAMALTKIFGLESDELVKREMASDSKYRTRRSKSLTSICIRKGIVFNWDMPLEHEPPSKQEIETLALKSCLQKKKGASPRSVHWPSNIVDQCQVTNVAGYDDAMKGDCFYNSSEIESFRLEVFFENNQDEFEVVDDDEEYEYIEIIEEEEEEEEYEYEYYEEELVEEWYEEEVIEDTPEAQSISRRISF